MVDNTTGSAPTAADSNNASCTGSGTPWSCCTGSGTGSCSAGNPYTQNSTVSNTTGTTRVTLLSAPINNQIKATDTITVTLSNVVQYKSMSVLEVSGLDQTSTAVTVDVHPVGATGNNISPTLSSGTRTFSDELIVACLGIQANTGVTYGRNTGCTGNQTPYACCTGSGAGTCATLIAGGADGVANDGATVLGSTGNATGITPRILFPEAAIVDTIDPFVAGGPSSISATRQWALALVSFKGL